MNDYNNVIMWSPGVTLDAIEKQVVLRAFRFYRGNKTVTANALGIAIRTLDNKLEKYQKEDKEQEIRDENHRRNREEFLNRQRGIGGSQQNQTVPLRAEAPESTFDGMGLVEGPRVESVTQDSAEQAVPVSKRTEVQEMLPSHTSKSRNLRSGKNVSGANEAARARISNKRK